MSILRAVTVALVLVGVSAPCLANGGRPTTNKLGYDIPLPVPLGAGTLRRTLVLDWNGDGTKDVVMVGERQALLAFDPATHASVAIVPTLAYDGVAIPRAAVRADEPLILLGEAGLRMVRFDPFTNGFAITPLQVTTWAGATNLRTVDLDHDGQGDLIALSNDGLALLTLIQGPGLTFSAGPTITFAQRVQQLEAIEWDGDPETEFALVNLAGTLQVIERTGLARVSIPTSYSEHLLLPVDLAGEDHQRLVWVYRDGPTHQGLLVIDKHYPAVEFHDLGPISVAALARGHHDFDASDDLYLAVGFAHLVYRCVSGWDAGLSGEAYPFDVQHVTPLVVGGAGSAYENQAAPVIADLDNDGDGDLVIPVQDEGLLHYDPNPLLRADRYRPPIKAPVIIPGHLKFVVQAPSQLPSNVNRIYVDAWRQATFQSEVDPIGLVHVERDVGPSWNGQGVPFQIDLPEISVQFPTVYTLQVRMAEVDPATGRLVRTYTARTMGYANDAVALTGLVQEAIDQNLIPVTNGLSDDPTQGGKFVPRANVHPFHQGTLPKQGPTSP